MMSRWFFLAGVLATLCCFTGCGTSAKPVMVSGTVDLDGKPLEDGTITLTSDAGVTPDTLPVKGGKFEGEAKPGKKKVEIRAFKMGKPTKMGDQEIPATPENFLPDRFNTKSTLTAEVTATGINP